MFQDRLQALWGALAAGWEKEGELVTSSLEFEFRLQFPCGFPVDCHISANQCECKQSLKNMWKIIANVISAIQHFASTFSTLACSRLSDSRAGSELGCTPGKQVGGGGEVSPRFFFSFVNFSLALYYPNAWNRLFRCSHSNSRDVIASSPSFSCPATRAPLIACSQASSKTFFNDERQTPSEKRKKFQKSRVLAVAPK